MDEPDSAERFAVGWCDTCRRDTITHVADTDTAGEQRLCVYCDGKISEGLRRLTLAELRVLGFAEIPPDGDRGNGGCGSCGCH